MREVEIRAAIYRLKLKPNTKLTLLGVLSVVDWQTFSGPCSSRDVGRRMAMKETSVRRSFKELTDMGLIRRSASRRAVDQHHRAVTHLEVKTILDLAHSELPPLAHSELQYNLDNNLDNNPSSIPLSTEESNEEVNGEFDGLINELAEMTHCSLDEARDRVEHYASVRQLSPLDALKAIKNMTAKMRRAR